MNAFKKQCIELRKRDYTLPEIARITRRPKSSVYVHIRNLPLSAQKWKLIKAAHGIRAIQIAARRRGVSARYYRPFSEWDADKISLVSHLLFDGEIKRTVCAYHNRNMSLLKHVESCMDTMYDREPKRWHNKLTGVHRISYFNVSLSAYLKQKSEELLRDIVSFPTHWQQEFLRSFFDDEGCMDFRAGRNTRRIRGYQKNVDILRLVQKLLLSFDIFAKIHSPNEIVITGKGNLLRFQKEIGFSRGVRINGRRSNSIWKESLEKREILQRAIASFKPVGSNGVHRNTYTR